MHSIIFIFISFDINNELHLIKLVKLENSDFKNAEDDRIAEHLRLGHLQIIFVYVPLL